MRFRKCNKCSLLIFTLFLLITTNAVALAEDDKNLSIIEMRMEATVCIGIVENEVTKDSKIPKKIFKPIGTGVVIGIPEDPKKRVCLITAKHVFEHPSKKWHPPIVNLRFTWHQHLSLEEYHGIPVRIRDEKMKFWIEHPEADLASIPLLQPPIKLGKKTVSAVLVSQFLYSDNLSIGQPVMVLGFPGAVRVSLGSSFMTLPLARRGIISWVPNSDQMPQAILIDTMAFPGNSGGPVFNLQRYWDEYGKVIQKPQPTGFIGIVTKAALQIVDIGAVEVRDKSKKKLKPVSLDYMGLTQIEPADRVEQLLEIVKKEMAIGTEPSQVK